MINNKKPGANKMTKAEMINAIIGSIKNQKSHDMGDLFFSLVFCTEANLRKICNDLHI